MVVGVTSVTLTGAFFLVSVAMQQMQLRALTDALQHVALAEARWLASRDGAVISDLPGPVANDVGPLPKRVAVFASDGRLLASNFQKPPPLPEPLPDEGETLDVEDEGERLLGVLTTVPGRADLRVLVAASRGDIDGDRRLLRNAMLGVFGVALACAMAMSSWVVARVTRHQARIAAVARSVAGGDLSARIGRQVGAPEERQLERDVDAMIDRLEALVTSHRRFVAHAAHELRSPLTTLYGELSHALRRSRSESAYREAIAAALASARDLRELAEDLLTLVRIGADARPARVELLAAKCAASAVVQVAGPAEAGGVGVEIRGEAAPMLGHPRDLERMLRNLLENAIRHSPRGGRIEVCVRDLGDAVELDVLDAGPGIDAADRERIFEPFQRTTDAGPEMGSGCGLGLTIAREIALSHGGSLAVVDAPAPWTTCFRARFPRAPSDATAGEPSRHAVGAAPIYVRS
jgi:two-component system heavy metal sensor histidine kinase CusS